LADIVLNEPSKGVKMPRSFTTGVGAAILLLVSSAGCAAVPARYVVPTPTPCHEVEKVEENRVYLRSSGKICIQSLGRVTVTLDRKYDEVEIYTDGRLWDRVSPNPE
jgi:hypothetical protein